MMKEASPLIWDDLRHLYSERRLNLREDKVTIWKEEKKKDKSGTCWNVQQRYSNIYKTNCIKYNKQEFVEEYTGIETENWAK